MAAPAGQAWPPLQAPPCPSLAPPPFTCAEAPWCLPLGALGQQRNQRGAMSSSPGVHTRLVAHRVAGTHGPAAPSDLG